jgi:hypothetical protein
MSQNGRTDLSKFRLAGASQSPVSASLGSTPAYLGSVKSIAPQQLGLRAEERTLNRL